MIRAGQIVAQRLRRPCSQEYRTGILDVRQQGPGIFRYDFQMLRCDLIGQFCRLFQVPAYNRAPEITQRRRNDL